MTWEEFDAWLRDQVARASDAGREALAEDTIRRLMRDELFAQVPTEGELTPAAWSAFVSARDAVQTAPAAELKRLIAIVDAGVLTDGNMARALLVMIEAIDVWATFRQSRDPDAVFQLANLSVEDVDDEVGASLGDFLATPEMRAERDRIARALGISEGEAP